MSPIDSRLARLQKKLKEKKLDAFLNWEPHNVEYLTGSEVEGKILFTGKEKFFVTTPLFAEEARLTLKDWQIVIIQRDSFPAALSRICKKFPERKIGFEASHLSYEEYCKLSKIKGVGFVPCSQLVEKLREVKDEKELSLIKEAHTITEAAFDHAEELLESGITEKELSAEIMYFLRKSADSEAFPPIVLFGERTSLPHGRPTQRKLGENELVLLDLGAKVGGYCSDITKTIFFGEVDQKWYQIRDLISKIQKEAVEKINPGVPCSQIDRLVRKRLKEAGYLNSFLHNSGHGVGLEVHEQPVIGPKSKKILKRGMVIALEPGVYLPGEGGMRRELMVMVTNGGGKILR
ncbi:MAG: M24 family metallopeptidase [bacterium]